jgi:hypothetical protein
LKWHGRLARESSFYISIEVEASTQINAVSIAPHIARPIADRRCYLLALFALRNCLQSRDATLQTALGKMALCKFYMIFIYLKINNLHDLNGFV